MNRRVFGKAHGVVLGVALLASTTALVGCGSDRSTGPGESPATSPGGPIEGSSAGFRFVARFGSNIDGGRIRRLMASSPVASELARFGGEGYRPSPGDAMSLRARRPGDGAAFDLTILPLDRGDPDAAVYLVCCETAGRSVVVPARIVRDGDQVRWKVLDPLDPAAFPWRNWAACILGRVAGGITGCWRGCRWAWIGRTECMKVCGGWVTLTALVSCTVQFVIAG